MRVPCIPLRRVELGLKSLLRQVVGELVADMVQEEGGWRKYFFHMEWWVDATPFSIVDGNLLLA